MTDTMCQTVLHEHLKIGVKTASVGNASLTLHYAAKNGEGDLCFTGVAVMVQIAKDTGKPRREWPRSSRLKGGP